MQMERILKTNLDDERPYGTQSSRKTFNQIVDNLTMLIVQKRDHGNQWHQLMEEIEELHQKYLRLILDLIHNHKPPPGFEILMQKHRQNFDPKRHLPFNLLLTPQIRSRSAGRLLKLI